MRTAILHPVATGMVFLAVLVFGWVAYQRLAVELMPDISYPTITVRTTYEGAAPQEVETQISRPIEAALATLDGLVTIESRSRAGVSDVVLGFDWGTDMAGAMQTIRENLQTTWLPTEADRPLIMRYDPSLDPFLRLALAVDAEHPPAEGDANLFLLRELADEQVKRELEALPGVAAVRIRGGMEREIRVETRHDWLAARKLTLETVRNALASENINVAGGSILEGETEHLVRTLNEYTGVEDLMTLKIRRSDGVLVPITDVATISETHRDRDVISRWNGGEAVELEVFKEADANIVAVSRQVTSALGEAPKEEAPAEDGETAEAGDTPEEAATDEEPHGIRAELPDGVHLEIVEDQASFIETAIQNLRDTAVLGSLLAIAILYLFLRDLRSTAIIGLSIPVSVVLTFAPLYLLDVSLNLMSLGGLALGVGMLVDNSVVVLENIQRFRDEGLGRAEAAAHGAFDVAMAVTASTLTTVAVFLPIAFVGGVAGELFGDLSLAVVSSLMASLAVALFLVPTLSALEPSHGGVVVLDGVLGRLHQRAEIGLFSALLEAARDVFRAPRDAFVSSWRSARWGRVLLPYWLFRFAFHFAFGCCAGAMALVAAVSGWVGVRVYRIATAPVAFVARGSASVFQAVYGRFASRYPPLIDAALRRPGWVLAIAVLASLVSLQWLGTLGAELIPEVHQGRFVAELALPVGNPLSATDRIVARAEEIARAHPDVEGVYAQIGADPRTDARSDEGEHTGRLRVSLKPHARSAEAERRVVDELRAAFSELGTLEVKMVAPSLFTFRAPVEVVVYGEDLVALEHSGRRVRDAIAGVEGLRDVRTSLVPGHPEVQIQYDRGRLHHLGLDPSTVANQVRDQVQGVVATRVRRGDQRIDLRVQLWEPDRENVGDIKALNVNPAVYPEVPLLHVAEFDEGVGPSEIRRVDQQRAVVVTANLAGFDLRTAADGIDQALQSVDLPDGETAQLAGQFLEMQSSQVSLLMALGLAVFLVYVIMASTFEHLVHPLVILLSVPMALVGTVGAMALTGTALSVISFLGMIVLAGVVVNNAIVLVDAVNHLRAGGMHVDAALRRAGALRLRPILITSGTTVLGLLPLAFGIGAGAEVQQPLAIAVIGGLTSSTLLTLVVVPAMYAILARRTVPAPVGEGEPVRP